MSEKRSALYIHADGSMDVSDVCRIARREGKRALKTEENVEVLDVSRFDSDFVVVVQPESYSPPVVGETGKRESESSAAH